MSETSLNEKQNPLQIKLAQAANDIEELEQQLAPIFQALEKKAQAPELSKCLNPEQTDIVQHQNRIKLIRESLDLEITQIGNSKIKATKMKTPSPAQDLDIIAIALKYQNQKLAIYELIHPILSSLELQPQADLIEQTITDNRNTNTWLRQIILNVLAPVLG